MSCGGNITIFGLFPEDDVAEIPCFDYVRPTCTQFCIKLDGACLKLPLGIIQNPVAGVPWNFSTEYRMDYQDPAAFTGSGIFEEAPIKDPITGKFSFGIKNLAPFPSNIYYDLRNISAVWNPSVKPLSDEWHKVEFDYDGVNAYVRITYLDRPGTPTYSILALAAPPDFTFPDHICWGRDRDSVVDDFVGFARYAKYTYNGVVLAEWDLASILPYLGATVTDISGNNNHGIVNDLGASTTVDCSAVP